MPSLTKLPTRRSDGAVHVVVESPRGATVKLKYDPEIGAFTLSRPLVLGVRYPFDWGFVPSTLAEDGDPLDAMVLHEDATYPGVVLACRPIGVVEVSQKSKERPGQRERNDRVILVPAASPRLGAIRSLDDVPERTRHELEHFFLAATALQDKEVRIEGWQGAEAAEAAIDRASLGQSREG